MNRALPAVLVVEDNAPLAELMRDILVELGHEAQTVPTRDKALDVVRDVQPGIIISDWLTDGMGWLEFRDTVNALGSNAEHIVCSAWPEAQATAEEHGARFLAKPFDIAELIELLTALTERPCTSPDPSP